MTHEEEFRELLAPVDDPAPVPAEFEKKLWNDLRGTLQGPGTANVERVRHGVKPPAITPESKGTPTDAAEVVEVDFVARQQRRRVEPRMIRAAAVDRPQ